MATKPHLPLSRINTIMKSSSEVEKISKESSQMMTKATELFIRTLAQEGYKLTNHGKKLDYKHLAEVVNNDDRYEFVRDIMPKKITVLEYKKIMARKQNLNNSTSSSDDDDDDDDDDEGDEEEEDSNSDDNSDGGGGGGSDSDNSSD